MSCYVTKRFYYVATDESPLKKQKKKLNMREKVAIMFAHGDKFWRPPVTLLYILYYRTLFFCPHLQTTDLLLPGVAQR